MPIQLPQKQNQGSFGKVGTLVGAVAGAYTGGPKGALEGAQRGGSAGGMVDSLAGGPKDPPPQLSSAMDRRMQREQEPLPAAQIQQAETALAALPPEQQKAYGATFRRARMMEEGMA